ncbi:TetR/AcrR family transcriptional regulator [Streptomyces polyrhachis]|uniref:TetR/AcrR family transcriptional regulator n=1 Tax=Streptomyces polyrhachis TaxID=1282885 RepID=A0ABW2GF38_9ACTN
MARTPSSRMLPAERQAQLLAAARRVLETKPIDEVSVETVAAEAEVSPGLLFHYFGSQRKFRQAVLEMAAGELLDHIRPDPLLSPAEQLHSGIETFVDYVSRFPSIYRAVIRLNHGSPTLHASVRATLAGWITTTVEEAGAELTPALRLTVAGWLAYMEEAVLGWLAGAHLRREELTEMCEQSFYLLARGMVADEQRWAQIEEKLRRQPAQDAGA